MPRITKVYTRTGDDGTTGLGSGKRVPKTSPRIAAYGAVDELNAHIGVAIATNGLRQELTAPLRQVQNDLFHAGSDLCVPQEDRDRMPVPTIEQRHIDWQERVMDQLSESLKPLDNFILPGGTPAAAQLHVARTVCRRAERDVFALAASERVNLLVATYLNRLSDLLFVMARFQNTASGVADPLWDSRR